MTSLRVKNLSGLTRVLWLSNVLFAVALGVAVWFSHQQHIRLAQERAENTSLTLERSLSGMFDQIDLMLVSVVEELESNAIRGVPNTATVNALIERLVHYIPGLNVASYSDASGLVAAEAGYPPNRIPVSIQDRDYFQHLISRPASGMLGSIPVIGRTSGKWAIIFARPYRDPGGAFAGVVFASIDLGRFSDMFAALKLGERSRIALTDQDFIRIAAHPMVDPSALGKRMAQDAIIQQLQTGTTTLTTEFTTKLDDVRRIYAFRKLETRPYWIMTALSVEDELASWRQQVVAALLIMIVFIGLTGISGRQVLHSWRRQIEVLSTLESTLESTDNGILVVDEQGRALHYNRRFTEMWNISCDVADTDASLLLNGQEQLSDPPAFQHDVQILSSSPATEASGVLTFRDGRIFEWASRPMRANDRITGRVWSFRDIRERQQAEDALRESEQRFRGYFNLPLIGIAITSLNKGWLEVNPKLCEILGYPREELVALTWVEITHPDDLAKDVAEFGRVLLSEIDGYSLEKRFIRKNGETIHAAIATHCVRRVDGSIDYFLAVVQDITERKRAEDELRNKNNALERSNAELEAYAYVASHDLREPLRNVTAFSTMLARRLEGRLRDDEPELLKIVGDAASRMDSLVRDLLEVSRIGRSELPMQPVFLDQVVSSALMSLRTQIEAAGATVEVCPNLPNVMGNEEELYRVFLNIIANALKYRQGSSPVIHISSDREGLAAWRVQVRDNGIGIETGLDYEERIFGLFQRLHQRHEYGGGTGIGLPICRKIVNRHGGRIWATSSGIGKGTTISFTLPIM